MESLREFHTLALLDNKPVGVVILYTRVGLRGEAHEILYKGEDITPLLTVVERSRLYGMVLDHCIDELNIELQEAMREDAQRRPDEN